MHDRNSFTAIGGNLVGVPLLLGNVVLWKPAPMATYASWIVLQILHEAGLPRGVVQFLPCVNGQETIDLVEKVNHLVSSHRSAFPVTELTRENYRSLLIDISLDFISRDPPPFSNRYGKPLL